MTVMKTLAMSCLVLALASCASMEPTGYTMANDKADFGYRHTQLTDDKYRISFRGNRKTDTETIRDYALLHAADLTLQEGYDWFSIASQDMETNKKNVPTSSTVATVGTRTSTSCGLLGCTTVHHPQYTGVMMGSEEVTSDRQFIMTISMGKGKPANPNAVYDAKALAKNIRASI